MPGNPDGPAEGRPRGLRRTLAGAVERLLLKALMLVAVAVAERGLRRAFARRALNRASAPGSAAGRR